MTAKPPGPGTAHQPRRPAGAGGGRGGQWSNKPVADSPQTGGMRLSGGGSAAGGAVDGRAGPTPPDRRHGEADSVKLAGPRAGGRRLQVTVRRDPDTGMWVNPTMFGDEAVRMFSDTPWGEGGAEEAKGVHAQVFVDMLNAGDALPCPEHAKAALKGTQKAGQKWAGWPNPRASIPVSDHAVLISAAARSETYFRDRLHRWGQTGADDDGLSYPPVVYDCELYGLFSDEQWQGEDGRLLERLAMLEDLRGNTVLDKPNLILTGHRDVNQRYSCLPLYLLGFAGLDQTVKIKCLDMLEMAQLQYEDWEWIVLEIHRAANRASVCVLPDAVSNILHYTRDDGDNGNLRYNLIKGLAKLKGSGWHPDSELFTREFLGSEINEHIAAELFTRKSLLADFDKRVAATR